MLSMAGPSSMENTGVKNTPAASLLPSLFHYLSPLSLKKAHRGLPNIYRCPNLKILPRSRCTTAGSVIPPPLHIMEEKEPTAGGIHPLLNQGHTEWTRPSFSLLFYSLHAPMSKSKGAKTAISDSPLSALQSFPLSHLLEKELRPWLSEEKKQHFIHLSSPSQRHQHCIHQQSWPGSLAQGCGSPKPLEAG